MPIALSEPPQAVAELTQTTLQHIALQKDFRVTAVAEVAPEQIRLGSGHPVYNLGLSDIVAGKPPGQLRLLSWRFIVQGSGSEPVAAETLSGDGATGAAFASVNSGPFVAGTVAALAATMNDPAFAQGQWEVRLLRVPALFVFAVWAHQTNGAGDRLRPIQPAPASLDPARTYDWNGFLAALRPGAQERLAADDGLRG